jgi:tetratricopeptide (TPR) repeat protein
VNRFAFACCSLLFFASTANADWLEASSDHFVIYSDQSEKSLRLFAERLELFHAAMAKVLRKDLSKPSPSNRVTIYVVSNEAEVRELVRANSRYIAGVYLPRAGSTVALIPQLKGAGSKFELSPETILYHEYAHHFMAGITVRAYPRWFVEGFAEFFASVRFRSENVDLGMPATHRAVELELSRRVPMRQLLSYDGGAQDPKFGSDAFYGESWALFHSLEFAPERAGQLAKYQDLLAQGTPALEAAEGAFGDLDKLDKDMRAYWRRRLLSYLALDRNTLVTGPINVGKLSPGVAEMMPTAIRFRVGAKPEEAVALLPQAQRVAARHPDDAAVLADLAKAEFDAGNDDAAIAAADRAIAIDPRQINAQIQKGYALFHKVETGVLPKESWLDVRNQFVKANKIENDNPIPLVQYYVSFLVEGEQPTRNSIDGLAWAMELAPFDSSVRWMVARQLIADDRLADAAQTLAPLAYSPHRNENTDRALQLLKDVEARIAAAQGPAAE